MDQTLNKSTVVFLDCIFIVVWKGFLIPQHTGRRLILNLILK